MRTFIFVQDVARAFDTILHKGKVGQVYNIGSDNERSNLEIAVTLLEYFNLVDKKDQYLTFVQDRLFNDKRYAINSQKLHDLGWYPEVPFKQGIKITIDWYKDNMKNWENLNLH